MYFFIILTEVRKIIVLDEKLISHLKRSSSKLSLHNNLTYMTIQDYFPRHESLAEQIQGRSEDPQPGGARQILPIHYSNIMNMKTPHLASLLFDTC